MIGRKISNYTIERLIGEGGMGNVYLGVHAHLDRKVAIKALHPMLAQNAEIRERFRKEASTLSQCQHPNIVTLFDYVEEGNEAFLIMEYVEGLQLDEYIQKVSGPIPENKTIDLFSQILDGVGYAHSLNIVHRDIKPSNFIITNQGKVKILDFGIAKILSETSHKLTKTGAKIGTILYMSPEQIKGQAVDKRTDIYSLGITLFQMLTGKCPYHDDTTEYEVSKKIVEEPLPDPKLFYPGVSEKIKNIINKASAKEPQERFQSCEEFKAAFIGDLSIITKSAVNTVITEPIIKAAAIPQKQQKKQPPEKKKNFLWLWIMIGILVVIAIFGISIKYFNASSSSDTPEKVAEKFLNHINKKEFAEAKKIATPESAASIDMLESFTKMGGEQTKETKIENLKCKEDGDKAACDYTENGVSKKLDLVKIKGKWLVEMKKESPDMSTEPSSDTTAVIQQENSSNIDTKQEKQNAQKSINTNNEKEKQDAIDAAEKAKKEADSITAIEKTKSSIKYIATKFLNHLNKQEFTEAKKLATPESAASIDMLESFSKMGGEQTKKAKIENLNCEEDGNRAVCYYSENGEAKKLDLVKIKGKWLVELKKESPDK